MINVPYDEYQQDYLLYKTKTVMQVLHRNIYSSGGDLSVSAIFRNPDYVVSLRDGIAESSNMPEMVATSLSLSLTQEGSLLKSN